MESLKGKSLLNHPFYNKGTAFTEEERTQYQLEGLLPTKVRTLEEQIDLEYGSLSKIEDNYKKNQYLMNIYNTNRTLFYAIVSAHLVELLPVIYTPTIADSVMKYSHDYKVPNDAVFLDVNHPETIKASLQNATSDLEQIDLLVITDGEGVLGIGDWGINGVMISVGKLAVYTVASGLNPRHVLPIVIDNGTNRQELLDDPNYLGNRHARKTGQEYLDYIDAFIKEAENLFPDVLFHWEDFGRSNASVILEKYKNDLTTFNDDIQGTGVMMAAAMHAATEVSAKAIQDHRYVIFGAGTAGIGVADQIRKEMELAGLSEEDAYKRFYLVDRYGLITEDMDDLTEGQKRYARASSEFEKALPTLEETIEAVKPSVLIGTSGQPGSFTESIVKKMASYNERPAILPISNPTKLCEAKASDIIKWSDGQALVVTGSPSEPVEYKGVTYKIGQANNALLYPGLGLGIVAAKASQVTEKMLSSAANGIVSLQDLDKRGAAILPHVKYVREASKLVAIAVVEAAIADGVATKEIADATQAVESIMWEPTYK